MAESENGAGPWGESDQKSDGSMSVKETMTEMAQELDAKMGKMFECFSQSLPKRRHSSDADSGSDSQSDERNRKRRTEDGEDNSDVLVVEGKKRT